MDPFAILVAAGLLTVFIGLGVVNGVKYKGSEIEVKPNITTGRIVSFLGLVTFGVGILGLLGVVGASRDRGLATQEVSTTSRTTVESGVASTPTTPPAVPSSETSSDIKDLRLDLKTPAKNSSLPVTGGPVSGQLEGNLGTGDLWLFTLSDGKWYLNQQIPVSADGSFKVASGQIGSPAEVGLVFTFKIVVTDATQTSLISNAQTNADGDVFFNEEPGRVLASRAIVRR